MIQDYAGCSSCPLAERPPVIGFGPQPASIMIIGEAPGKNEVIEKRPFIGMSGQLLRRALSIVGIDPNRCRITNMVVCHPTDNATPTKEMLAACRDRLLAEIEQTSPQKILLLGATSLDLLGWKSIVRSRGLGVMVEIGGRQIYTVATYHPAAVLRSDDLFRDFIHDINKLHSHDCPREHILPTIFPIPTTYEEIRDSLEIFKSASSVSCDTETTGVEPTVDVIQAIGFGALTDEGEGISFVIPHDLIELSKPLVVDFIRSYEGTLVFHNIKFDMSFFRVWSGDETLTPQKPMDTLMMVYASDERGSASEGSGMAYFTAGLKDQARLRYDIPDYHFDFETFQAYSDETKPWMSLYVYLAIDCIITIRLFRDLLSDLEAESPKLIPLVQDLLVPGALAFGLVETRGFHIDRWYLEGLRDTLEEESGTLKEELQRQAKLVTGNDEFNPASPKQVREIAARWGFNPPSFEKEPLQVEIETGRMPDECREFFRHLLEFRQKSKVLQTYILGILKRLDSNNRLHPDFLLHGTDTGRLSCRNPNLQNIPSIMGPAIKKAFRAPKGWVVMNADYSQLELRVAAFYSRDASMIQAYQEGRDLHRWVASLMFHKPPEEISSFERYLAKYLDFGLLYGRQARGLMEGMEAVYILKTTGKAMTVQEADSLQKAFFDAFPGLSGYIRQQHKQVRDHQFVETPTGRRRRFPFLNSINRSSAERKGVNTPIQSLASDMTLNAVIQLTKNLDPSEAFIVSSVHDSIMLQVREDLVDEIAVRVKAMMEQPVIPEFDIPLRVDIAWAASWGDAKD